MIPFWDIAAIQFFGPEKENSDYQHIIMSTFYGSKFPLLG